MHCRSCKIQEYILPALKLVSQQVIAYCSPAQNQTAENTLKITWF